MLFNDCGYVAGAYHVSLEELHIWNPSLAHYPEKCELQQGYSYCVLDRDQRGEFIKMSTYLACLSFWQPRPHILSQASAW